MNASDVGVIVLAAAFLLAQGMHKKRTNDCKKYAQKKQAQAKRRIA